MPRWTLSVTSLLWILGAAALFAGPFPPGGAFQGTTDSPGLSAARAGDWAKAIPQLQAEAYRAPFDPRRSYNLALAHQKAGHLNAATGWYRVCLAADAGGTFAPRVRPELAQLCDQLEGRGRRAFLQAETLALGLPKEGQVRHAALERVLTFAWLSGNEALAAAMKQRIERTLPGETMLSLDPRKIVSLRLNGAAQVLDLPKARGLHRSVDAHAPHLDEDVDLALLLLRLARPAEAWEVLSSAPLTKLDATQRGDLWWAFVRAGGTRELAAFGRNLLASPTFSPGGFNTAVATAEHLFWSGERAAAQDLAQRALDHYRQDPQKTRAQATLQYSDYLILAEALAGHWDQVALMARAEPSSYIGGLASQLGVDFLYERLGFLLAAAQPELWRKLAPRLHERAAAWIPETTRFENRFPLEAALSALLAGDERPMRSTVERWGEWVRNGGHSDERGEWKKADPEVNRLKLLLRLAAGLQRPDLALVIADQLPEAPAALPWLQALLPGAAPAERARLEDRLRSMSGGRSPLPPGEARVVLSLCQRAVAFDVNPSALHDDAEAAPERLPQSLAVEGALDLQTAALGRLGLKD